VVLTCNWDGQANIIWTPVVLGGLYELSNAPQGKDGSSGAVVPENRKRFLARAFQRDLKRYHVPLTFPRDHPLKTVDGNLLEIAQQRIPSDATYYPQRSVFSWPFRKNIALSWHIHYFELIGPHGPWVVSRGNEPDEIEPGVTRKT
jgi:hypothetical protein